jgi:hypothetical protein
MFRVVEVMRMLGPMKYEVSEEWRKLCFEKLYKFYFSMLCFRGIK